MANVMMNATDLKTGQGYYGTMRQVSIKLGISGRKASYLHKHKVTVYEGWCISFNVEHVKKARGQKTGVTPKHLQQYHYKKMLQQTT